MTARGLFLSAMLAVVILMINKNNGAAGSWTKLTTSAPGAYSRSLMVPPDASKLLIVGAGYNGNTMNSAVRADMISIS